MNQSTVERALMLVGSLLLVLFALSFMLPGLANYKNEIKLLVLAGVILYAAYSFWTRSIGCLPKQVGLLHNNSSRDFYSF